MRRKALKTRTSNSEARASEATNDASRKQEPARTRLPRLWSPPAPRPRRGPGHRAQRPGRPPRRRRRRDAYQASPESRNPLVPVPLRLPSPPAPRGGRGPGRGAPGPFANQKNRRAQNDLGGGRPRRQRGADDRSRCRPDQHAQWTRRGASATCPDGVAAPKRPSQRSRRAGNSGSLQASSRLAEQRRQCLSTKPLTPTRFLVCEERL